MHHDKTADVLEGLAALIESMPRPYPYTTFPAVMKICKGSIAPLLASKLGVTSVTIHRWADDVFRPSRDMENREIGLTVEYMVFETIVQLRDAHRNICDCKKTPVNNSK